MLSFFLNPPFNRSNFLQHLIATFGFQIIESEAGFEIVFHESTIKLGNKQCQSAHDGDTDGLSQLKPAYLSLIEAD